MYESRPGKVEEVTGDATSFEPAGLFSRRLAFYANKDIKNNGMPAMVAPILEPLKCRLITKGPAIPYWVAMPLQKYMLNRIQEFPQFALTGQPISESLLSDLLQRETRLNLKEELKFDQWVSGDYSAATDGLSTVVNSVVFKECLDILDLTPNERAVFEAVLGPHTIEYPENIVGTPGACRLQAEHDISLREPFEQKNGQLMGSPLSFPVLCAINLIAYWLALEEYTDQVIPLWDLPCLINGDDILFRANNDFYIIWQKWVKTVGFTLSPGKNFISPHFLTVNSRAWLFNSKKSTFQEVQYLNTGILLENAPGPGSTVDKLWLFNKMTSTSDLPFMDKMETVIQTSVNKARTYRRFTHYNLQLIKRYTDDGQYTLFGDVQTGGMGLTALVDDFVYYTGFQLKLSQFLRFKNRKRIDNQIMDPSNIEWLGKTVKRMLGVTLLPLKPYQSKFVIHLREKYEPLREFEYDMPISKSPLVNSVSLFRGVGEVTYKTKWPREWLLREFRSTFKKMKIDDPTTPVEYKFHYKHNITQPMQGFKMAIHSPAFPTYVRSLLRPHINFPRREPFEMVIPEY